jgi:hypothetical protein
MKPLHNKANNEHEINMNRLSLQQSQAKLLTAVLSSERFRKTNAERAELKLEKQVYRIGQRLKNPAFCKKDDVYDMKVIL